ncbi:hypothetical protein Cch01nite_22560 [Cellulomonas chitinilytica]|uniref:Uncharacterized protein n=1 Tax=Cellulomonas chitinilytica TaxID=398759 RepID=A0A919U2J4_9CELL|nr:hypothetical protein [Cellulomonas chitinilytica]GIG21532.1 hypothetical protein Cch01nite_22560 [Cellulomonas chitinilytica]
MSGPDPRFERSVAFWLRAYPRRWRAARGAELAAVAADLARPGAVRLDLRSAAGLVAGGWATRWRTRPPLRDYLLYRFADRRVPVEHRAWAADDLEGRFAGLRVGLSGPVGAAAGMLIARRWEGEPPDWAFVGLFSALLATMWLVIWPGRLEKSRRKHLVPQQGEPLVDGTRVYEWVPRDRVAARAGTLTTLLATALLAPAASVAWLVAPRRVATVACAPPDDGGGCFETVSLTRHGAVGPVLAALAVALLVGGAVAWLAARRLDRQVPVRPFQPARRVVGLGLRRAAGTGLVVVLVLADLAAEATGRIDLWAGAVLAVVALALLPACAVTWRVASRGPSDLAWSDVRRIVWTGHAPVVDQHGTGLVPFVLGPAPATPAGQAVAVTGGARADGAEAPRPDWLH